MVLSTALFDRPAFKNLVCNGLVLAADGKKMSKRLQNYPARGFGGGRGAQGLRGLPAPGLSHAHMHAHTAHATTRGGGEHRARRGGRGRGACGGATRRARRSPPAAPSPTVASFVARRLSLRPPLAAAAPHSK